MIHRGEESDRGADPVEEGCVIRVHAIKYAVIGLGGNHDRHLDSAEDRRVKMGNEPASWEKIRSDHGDGALRVVDVLLVVRAERPVTLVEAVFLEPHARS